MIPYVGMRVKLISERYRGQNRTRDGRLTEGTIITVRSHRLSNPDTDSLDIRVEWDNGHINAYKWKYDVIPFTFKLPEVPEEFDVVTIDNLLIFKSDLLGSVQATKGLCYFRSGIWVVVSTEDAVELSDKIFPHSFLKKVNL